MQISFAAGLTLLLILIKTLLAAAILTTRTVRSIRSRTQERVGNAVAAQLSEQDPDFTQFRDTHLLGWYNRIASSITLEENLEHDICRHLAATGYVRKLSHRLNSRIALRRIEAAASLRNLLREKSIRALFLNALKREKDDVVALYLFEALARSGDTRAIIPMIRRLGKSGPSMGARYRAILLTYAERLLPYLTSRLHNRRTYMGLLITEYAQRYPSESLREYLVNKAQESNSQVREQALRALSRHYPESLLTDTFFESTYRSTASFVIQAYAQLMDSSTIPDMLEYSGRPALADQLVICLTEMTTRDPSMLFTLLEMFESGMKHQVQTITCPCPEQPHRLYPGVS